MKSDKKTESVKKNLIESTSSLEDSCEALKRDNSKSFYNNVLNPFPKNDDWPVPGIMDFGGDLELSRKSTPMHSDDEVTPRRGLDEMMTESKLKGLEQLAWEQEKPATFAAVKQSVKISHGDKVIGSMDRVSPLKLQETGRQRSA
jgi:hypothetical protein